MDVDASECRKSIVSDAARSGVSHARRGADFLDAQNFDALAALDGDHGVYGCSCASNVMSWRARKVPRMT